MKFINKGKPIKIRRGSLNKYSWITLNKGDKIDLPEHVGKNNGLKKVKVTNSQAGTKKVETKQFENKKYVSFWNDLLKIKGVGLNTAKDIIKVFKTEEDLKLAISHDDELPFRDDVELKLRKKYGGNK